MRPPEKVLRDAQECLSRGGGALQALPSVIRRILEDGVWRQLPDKHGECFPDFPSFVEYPLWWGLETKYDRLVQFCRDDRECHALLLEQLEPAGKRGAPEGNQNRAKERENEPDNIRIEPYGTSSDHTLRRLKRDRPDLAERVIAGDLSANAAAIEAGFRRPMKSIPIDSPGSAVKALLRVFDRNDLLAALEDA
jgi:hypothetical protein